MFVARGPSVFFVVFLPVVGLMIGTTGTPSTGGLVGDLVGGKSADALTVPTLNDVSDGSMDPLTLFV
tara:strand:- start:1059 stop:1259 length:201 start_codon:yes stop_codon:yes gene_type:complete